MLSLAIYIAINRANWQVAVHRDLTHALSRGGTLNTLGWGALRLVLSILYYLAGTAALFASLRLAAILRTPTPSFLRTRELKRRIGNPRRERRQPNPKVVDLTELHDHDRALLRSSSAAVDLVFAAALEFQNARRLQIHAGLPTPSTAAAERQAQICHHIDAALTLLDTAKPKSTTTHAIRRISG